MEGDDDMIRGTTPTVEFELPMEVNTLSQLYVTFCQGGISRIEKTLADCVAAGTVLSTRLTQEETLRLNDKKPVEIQLRVKTMHGEVLASEIIEVTVERILKDGVI